MRTGRKRGLSADLVELHRSVLAPARSYGLFDNANEMSHFGIMPRTGGGIFERRTPADLVEDQGPKVERRRVCGARTSTIDF